MISRYQWCQPSWNWCAYALHIGIFAVATIAAIATILAIAGERFPCNRWDRTQSQRSLSVLWSLPSLESGFHIVIATIAEPFSCDRWDRKSSISDSNQLDSAPRSELITYCKTIGEVDSIAAYTCSIMSHLPFARWIFTCFAYDHLVLTNLGVW